MKKRGEIGSRIYSLEHEMSKIGLDGFLVTNETNVSYLSGFTGHDSTILVTRNKLFFLTDSRYIEEAEDTISGYNVMRVEKSLYASLDGIIRACKLKHIGFESMNLPYEIAKRLITHMGSEKLVPCRDVIENVRSVKSQRELLSIKNSIKLAKEVFHKTASLIAPGINESYLARRAGSEFIRCGAKTGFDTIVAAGKSSSKPHASPGQNKIKTGDFVMIDIGCTLEMYNSDITRMVAVGKICRKMAKIYGVVQMAQEKAFNKVRPGAIASEVDHAARDHINNMGYGKYFGHATGHGIGLDVHEQPSISSSSDTVLKPGMVFTVEPAVYIPGEGGVRIEDDVVVTEKGCQILSR